MSVKKAFSYADIGKRNFKMLPLQGEWQRHLGDMERSGSVLVLGDSGHGKTTYAMQLAKAICTAERVLYNSAEEGIRASFNRSLDLNNMETVKDKMTYTKEHYDILFERLQKKRQPKVVIIDSVQYCFRGKKIADYYKLIETYGDTLFIGISHVAKGMPKGAVANEFYWDCQNRVFIQDFKAYLQKSRCGGDETQPYIINAKKAQERELKLLQNG